MSLFVAVILALAQQPERLAVPDVNAQRDAEKFFKTLFKDEYKAKSDPDKIILAQKLYTQALEIKDNPARQYVALRECHAIALQAGMYERADKALEALRDRFHTPVSPLRLAVLTAKAKMPPEAKVFANEHFEVAEEAAAEEDFDTALKAAQAGAAIARKAKEVGLITRSEAMLKDLTERKAKFEPVRKAMETLKTKPADPEANLAAGRYRAFQKGDWTGGLPMLEKGSDARLRQLAGWDLGTPARFEDRLAVADGWWDAGEKESGPAQENLRRRSAHWYGLALPDAPEASRARLEERLKTAGVVPTPKATAGPFDLDERGAIVNWLVAGPFSFNGASPLGIDYLGGESKHVPGDGVAIEGAGEKSAWRLATVPGGRLNFHSVFNNGVFRFNQVAYVAAWVELESDVDLHVRVGSDDANRVWVDGEEIGQRDVLRGFQWDSEVYSMKMTKGRHLLLVKVYTREGGFEVGVRLTTRNLEIPKGIKIWN